MFKKWSKQITAIVMALAMLLSSAGVFALETVVPSVGGGLWANGGFETLTEDGAPMGYELYISGDTALAWEKLVVQNMTEANSGTNYICAEKKQTGLGFLASGLTEGKTYELSFYYRHDVAESTSASLLLRYAVDGVTGAYDKMLGLPVATEWTKHSETVVLNRSDAGVTGENGLLVNLIASQDANVCFDDIALREQPAASLISNGSFDENATGWTLDNAEYTTAENWDEGGSLYLDTTDLPYVAPSVEDGVIYKLTFMRKNATREKPKVHIRSSWSASGYYVNAYSFSDAITDWKEETLYFKAEGSTAIIRIGVQVGGGLYIDGVKLTKAVDTFGFYTAEGEVKEITADLLGKDITAKWNRVGAADADAMLITAVYKITGENTKQLVGIGTDAIDESSTALVQEISASTKMPSENGEYVVEAMFWESASGLSPLYRKETVR
ncbi:MAG: hypothetical protein E7390_02255 [Ruminococcaceae bacterium]|nr:hypothetical protein [Oscillospiraceae bacterium]